MAAPLPAPTAAPVAVPHPVVTSATSPRPTTGVVIHILSVFIIDVSSRFAFVRYLSIRLLAEAREEVLHAVTERRGTVLELLPRALGLGLGCSAGLLDSLSGILGAFRHRAADALGGILDALTRRLGSALDLPGRVLELGIVRRGRPAGRH